jgi:hypothetical protein
LDREQLIADLGSWGPAADAAAAALAERGDRDGLSEILRSIARDCGMESIPDAKIAAFVRLAGPEHVPLLTADLERLKESDLEDDAGDVGDEFWRVQTAVQRILVGIGRPAVEWIKRSLAATTNPYARESLVASLDAISSSAERP